MATYFNRYRTFISNGNQTSVPLAKIPEKSTDKFVIYNTGKSRLDKISQQYYSSPYFGWLIMQANLEYGGLEWNIPDQSIIRVPFPLQDTINDYNSAMDLILTYYGE